MKPLSPLAIEDWSYAEKGAYRIPRKELAAAFYYELARASEHVIDDVEKWREQIATLVPQLSSVRPADLLASALAAREGLALASSPHINLTPTGRAKWPYSYQWSIPRDLPAIFPEFPAKSWPMLPDSPAKRMWTKRLQQHSPLASLLRQRTKAGSKAFSFTPLIMVSPDDRATGKFAAALDIFEDYALQDAAAGNDQVYLGLSWKWEEYSDTEILQIIQCFLRHHRPKSVMRKAKPKRRTILGQVPFDWETGLRAISLWRRHNDIKVQMKFTGKKVSDPQTIQQLLQTYEPIDGWLSDLDGRDKLVAREIAFGENLVDWAKEHRPQGSQPPPAQRQKGPTSHE